MVISEARDNGKPNYVPEHFEDAKGICDIFNNDCI